MWLHEEFMDPIVEHLLPKINKRLNPPSDVLVDNSCWVLSFLGAFCVIIQLVAMKFYAGTVMEMADNMKQMEWFRNDEYELIKALLQRLYLIKGMSTESKMVLWRINVFVDRGMADHVAA
ncbi:hypothetical protein Rs2_16198 [Raphanus sativus]|nr:hypothetical protein Rs2_16198 [Raphanus sativus]